jgi:hypothetical protein
MRSIPPSVLMRSAARRERRARRAVMTTFRSASAHLNYWRKSGNTRWLSRSAMSAFGVKQKSFGHETISAFAGKTDMANLRVRALIGRFLFDDIGNAPVAPADENDFNFSDDVLLFRRQCEARRGILTQSGSGASKHAVMNRMSLGTVVTSRGVYRAARATYSRSRHPVGVRALTEL